MSVERLAAIRRRSAVEDVTHDGRRHLPLVNLDRRALLAEVERRLQPEDVERFLKRERDEYEPRGECWNTVDGVLDCFRLHMVTGTPLTEPTPHEGPEAPGVGTEPLTEAEELRAERDRLRAGLDSIRARALARSDQLLAARDCCSYDDRGRRRAFEQSAAELRSLVDGAVGE